MGKTVVNGNFEWDEEKNAMNVKKHGIDFEMVLPAFSDPCFFERYDEIHSTTRETRYIGIGRATDFVVVFTSYTERKRIRLISARLATSQEERIYYEHCKNFNA